MSKAHCYEKFYSSVQLNFLLISNTNEFVISKKDEKWFFHVKNYLQKAVFTSKNFHTVLVTFYSSSVLVTSNPG
jgi:hypothetical protein